MYRLTLPEWRLTPFTSSVISASSTGPAHRLREHPDGIRTVEPLGHVPRAAPLLRLGLEVAAREIDADRMAENAISGGVDRNVATALPDRMAGIVASDAEHPGHGKEAPVAVDGGTDGALRRHDVVPRDAGRRSSSCRNGPELPARRLPKSARTGTMDA